MLMDEERSTRRHGAHAARKGSRTLHPPDHSVMLPALQPDPDLLAVVSGASASWVLPRYLLPAAVTAPVFARDALPPRPEPPRALRPRFPMSHVWDPGCRGSGMGNMDGDLVGSPGDQLQGPAHFLTTHWCHERYRFIQAAS